jgi:hypothetical protein
MVTLYFGLPTGRFPYSRRFSCGAPPSVPRKKANEGMLDIDPVEAGWRLS